MRATPKKILMLALVFAVSSAAVAWLNQADGDQPAESKTTYYFANYDSADDILAVQIENEGGNVTLISSEGAYYADLGETESVPAEAQIRELFSKIYKLPLLSYLADAVSSDPQYGLGEPLAEVYIQNQAGDAFMFHIGRASPSRNAHYVCLAGDDRVFLMSREYSELFLSDPKQYVNSQ